MEDSRTGSQSSAGPGALGRDVSRSVAEMIDRVCRDAVQAVEAEVNVPQRYILLPEEAAKLERKAGREKDGAMEAASGIVPAALAALGLAVNAPAAAVVLLAGGGGMAVRFIGTGREKGTLKLKPLSGEDISVHLSVNPEKLEAARQESRRELETLEHRVAYFESRAAEVHDVALDRRFGEWVQQFIVCAGKRPEDADMQMLLAALMPRLAAMGIQVYDEVALKADGTPDVPDPDYLIDSRAGEEYTEVVRPAVYSDRGILARGEIR